MKNKKLLVVIDMQNDFIDGNLGSPEARAIVKKVANKITDFDGDVVYTRDEHYTVDNKDGKAYRNTLEGKKLPIPHCLHGTNGIYINPLIKEAIRQHKDNVDSFLSINSSAFHKNTFGCVELAQWTHDIGYESIEICGLCTDVCVVSNALLIRAYNKDTPMICDASCCAGTSVEAHKAALTVMRSCQIDVIGE